MGNRLTDYGSDAARLAFEQQDKDKAEWDKAKRKWAKKSQNSFKRTKSIAFHNFKQIKKNGRGRNHS